MVDAHANLATSLVAVAPSPATTGTTLTVTTGQGARFPTPPFNITVSPNGIIPEPSNAEILRVTGISGDVLTVQRIQESTSARTIVVGDRVSATITAKTLTDVETLATLGFPTFIQTSAPTGGQTSGLTKWIWVDTSTTPPTIKVEAATDVATTTLSSTSADDVEVLTVMGAV